MSRSVEEIPLPPSVRGTEALRVVVASDGRLIVMIRSAQFNPGEWGLLLHDVAQHVACGLVRAGLERVDGGPVTEAVILNEIVDMFQREHVKPSDVAKPYVDQKSN